MKTLLAAVTFVLFVACNADDEGTAGDSMTMSVSGFTEAAIQIEDERQSLLDLLSNSRSVGSAYLEGGTWPDGLDHAGAAELAGELALLNSPQATRPIKDALLLAYQMEIASSIDHGECSGYYLDKGYFSGDVELRCDRFASTVKPHITPYNVDDSFGTPWSLAQKIRATAYNRWYEILREEDIDPTLYPTLMGVRTKTNSNDLDGATN